MRRYRGGGYREVQREVCDEVDTPAFFHPHQQHDVMMLTTISTTMLPPTISISTLFP